MSTELEDGQRALAAWGLDGRSVHLAPVGDGNINTSLRVGDACGWRYLLQRVNATVFPDPVAVVENQRRVVAHLENARPPLVVPLEPTSAGNWYHVDGRGEVWRLQPYLRDACSIPAGAEPAQAAAAAGAFGRFQALLADLPEDALAVVIPRFHELAWQFERFDACLATGAARVALARDEIQFAASRRALTDLGSAGPRGVIHADCKIANLLFDATGRQVLAVVDLDTVMVGRRAWDFGDLVRSVLSGDERRAPEAVPPAMFRTLAEAFVAGGGERLVDDRALRAAMAVAPLYITFMLGLRFLIDYLEGDVYFRQRQPGDNLVRARAQFALARVFERAAHELETVTARI